MTSKKYNIFWFRRDLRLDDNKGLYKALQSSYQVLPIFIFDSEILKDLPKDDARLTFIHQRLQQIRQELQDQYNSSIAIFYGEPKMVFQQISHDFSIAKVYTNHDYEPYATERDQQIKSFLESKNIPFFSFKDQVIFEKNEVIKKDGSPYLVYTPYMRSWKDKFEEDKDLTDHPTTKHLNNLIQNTNLPNLNLEDLGFLASSIKIPDYNISIPFLNNYDRTRNIPSINGTSHLGPHLRFGTVSIRKVFKKAVAAYDDVFMNELIWREFFVQILFHFPETLTDAFKKKYDRIKWRNNELEFEKWKQGKTGYPIVDAGMRQLKTTGFMHNRVRMIVGSFLCKHLLIDWRWGEAYFAENLLDYEVASNLGNWQWVAGCGVDAAPYFRIFNPTAQMKKFDKNQEYIKKWVPELGTEDYPQPMVDHQEARKRCLQVYKEAVKE